MSVKLPNKNHRLSRLGGTVEVSMISSPVPSDSGVIDDDCFRTKKSESRCEVKKEQQRAKKHLNRRWSQDMSLNQPCGAPLVPR